MPAALPVIWPALLLAAAAAAAAMAEVVASVAPLVPGQQQASSPAAVLPLPLAVLVPPACTSNHQTHTSATLPMAPSLHSHAASVTPLYHWCPIVTLFNIGHVLQWRLTPCKPSGSPINLQDHHKPHINDWVNTVEHSICNGTSGGMLTDAFRHT